MHRSTLDLWQNSGFYTLQLGGESYHLSATTFPPVSCPNWNLAGNSAKIISTRNWSLVSRILFILFCEISSYLGKCSFNSPRQKSGLVHKGGEGVLPVQTWNEILFLAFFGPFLGLFRDFLGFFTNWKTHLSPEVPKGGGGVKKSGLIQTFAEAN